ncbi:MAG: TonB-dependent receptor [bacterium]
MKKYFSFLLVIIVILSSSQLQSQTEKTGTVAGYVTSTMSAQPLVGAIVRVVDTELGAMTDNTGKFVIKDVPVGRVNLKFSYVGYLNFTQPDIQVVSNKTINVDVHLTEAVVEGQEITVKAEYFVKVLDAATGTQSFSGNEIRNAPGVQEDPVRALQLLPGVNASSAGRNDLIVRGGAPFENLYIIDGIEVPTINHFSSQGSTGGPLSIINIDFVEDVEFSAGGFGARYGDKTSSLTNITMRSGNKDQFRGRVDLSATGVDGSLEGPIGKKGSYFLAARRSYLDFLFKAFGFAFIPQYWDFQAKVNYQLDDHNIFELIGFGVLDDVTIDTSTIEARFKNSTVAVPSQKQYIFGATWKHLFEHGYSNVILSRTFTNFSIFQKDSNLVDLFKNKSKEGEIGLKSEVFWIPNKTMEFCFGNNIKAGTLLSYDILIPGYMRTDQNGVPNELKIDTSFNVIKNATYASMTMGWGKHKVTAGLRGDYFSFTTNKYFLSPRISVFYTINENSTIISSFGRYFQSPSYIWLVGAKNQNLKPICADQAVLGYAHTPLKDLKVQLEVYYKWYSDYPARIYRPQAVLAPAGFDNVKSDIPYGLEPLNSTGTGVSRGVELFIQKKMGDIPLWGILSLTLCDSKFTSIDGKARPGAFDSRFITNFSLGYRISETWEISGKWKLATGVPTTPFTENGSLDYLLYNEGERLPVSHQLDMRLEKRWNLASSLLTTYIDVQNVYNRKNVSSVQWDERQQQAIYPSTIGILPSIGVLFEF